MSGRPVPEMGEAKGSRASEQTTDLNRYFRYVELVKLQEAALEGEDLERVEELGRAREALQSDLEDTPPEGMPREGRREEGGPESAQMRKLRQAMTEALLGDSRIRARLCALMKETSREIDRLVEKKGNIEGYLAQEGPVSDSRARRLNVQL